MREHIVAGNWKMNTDLAAAKSLAKGIADGLKTGSVATAVLCPPFPFLDPVHQIIGSGTAKLGAQNLYFNDDGAFTGEVSASMLKSVGCEFTIIGHSERRQLFGETDVTVNQRLMQALKYGLRPIICVGETLDERERHETLNVIRYQLGGTKAQVEDERDLAGVVIAYEPVWAIGTGKTATPEQAQEIHRFIRDTIGVMYSEELANAMPILYGGSVNAANAKSIFAQPDVDGGLVGGASLKADQFVAIANSF